MNGLDPGGVALIRDTNLYDPSRVMGMGLSPYSAARSLEKAADLNNKSALLGYAAGLRRLPGRALECGPACGTAL